MRILVSWIALREDLKNGQMDETGPTASFHRNFYNHDKHIILSTAKDDDNHAVFLLNGLKNKYPGRNIEIKYLNVNDPIDVREIMGKCSKFIALLEAEQIDAYISPGTPAMQVAWYIIKSNKEVDIDLYQTRRARDSKTKKPEIIKVTLDESSVPISAMYYEESLRRPPSKRIDGEYFITPLKAAVYKNAEKVAQTDGVTTLILGESGTGKEDLAKYICENSLRRKGPFESINCAAFSDQLLESRLFGYKKGAFTGALKDTPGLFEQAYGGTIFLDEIGDISPYMQQVLLRVLEEKKIRPIGGNKEIKVDFRAIAATNKNLVELCKKEKFRWDLYYRLAVVELKLPPLRSYPLKEVKAYIDNFCKNTATDFKKSSPIRPNKEAMDILTAYTYPGNLREMKNIIARLSVFNEGEVTPAQLPDYIKNENRAKMWSLEKMEHRHIQKALDHFEGNQRQTAIHLGVAINTLKSKMERYGISLKR